MSARLQVRPRLAGPSFIGAIAAGIVVAAMQAPPPSPRLTGEAAPPAQTLSLWYRAPASDHPLLPLDAPRQSRQAGTAEWVRALPVGNGRLGVMVFGGIVHERLQLNEDTLWAGRPYDPVNPEAKDSLPEVRRLHRRHDDARGNRPDERGAREARSHLQSGAHLALLSPISAWLPSLLRRRDQALGLTIPCIVSQLTKASNQPVLVVSLGYMPKP